MSKPRDCNLAACLARVFFQYSSSQYPRDIFGARFITRIAKMLHIDLSDLEEESRSETWNLRMLEEVGILVPGDGELVLAPPRGCTPEASAQRDPNDIPDTSVARHNLNGFLAQCDPNGIPTTNVARWDPNGIPDTVVGRHYPNGFLAQCDPNRIPAINVARCDPNGIPATSVAQRDTNDIPDTVVGRHDSNGFLAQCNPNDIPASNVARCDPNGIPATGVTRCDPKSIPNTSVAQHDPNGFLARRDSNGIPVTNVARCDPNSIPDTVCHPNVIPVTGFAQRNPNSIPAVSVVHPLTSTSQQHGRVPATNALHIFEDVRAKQRVIRNNQKRMMTTLDGLVDDISEIKRVVRLLAARHQIPTRLIRSSQADSVCSTNRYRPPY